MNSDFLSFFFNIYKETLKVICIKNPNKDYKDWIYDTTGLEIDSLLIFVGSIYNTIGDGLEGRCWGQIQKYYYISELSEVGKIPTKYFRCALEVRMDKIDDILELPD